MCMLLAASFARNVLFAFLSFAEDYLETFTCIGIFTVCTGRFYRILVKRLISFQQA